MGFVLGVLVVALAFYLNNAQFIMIAALVGAVFTVLIAARALGFGKILEGITPRSMLAWGLVSGYVVTFAFLYMVRLFWVG